MTLGVPPVQPRRPHRGGVSSARSQRPASSSSKAKSIGAEVYIGFTNENAALLTRRIGKPGFLRRKGGCRTNGAVYTMSDMDHLCFDTTKIDKIQDLLERGVTVYPYTFE